MSPVTRPEATPRQAPAERPLAALERIDEPLATMLRAEAHGMVRAYVNALLAYVHRDSVVGIYAKGSAYRPWDSVLDYVPELSDVDIHIRLRDDRARPLRDLTRALDVAGRALATFSALHRAPRHLPRPQLTPMAELETSEGYRPSPATTVHTLFGEPYEGASRAEYADVAVDDARRFRDDAELVLTELALKVIDRPGPMAWSAVSRVSWRVGTAGPRLLTQLGYDPYDSWCMNRTAVARELAVFGPVELAEAYADFYRAGWDGFRSGFRDGDAARRALLAAERVYRLGRECVRTG